MSAVVKFENKNPLLNSEVIKAFVESVKNTIKTTTSLQISSEKPYTANTNTIKAEIAGIVGITSNEHSGLLIMSFSKEAVLEIHNTMLGESETEMSQSVVDLVGELSNMVYGTSKSELNKMGYNFKMAIPTVAKGSFEITNKSKSLTIMMPFKISEKYSFMVSVSVE